MDVPDLDEALVEKIARQSDEQTGALSIRELERLRDDNLVAIIQRARRAAGRKRLGRGSAAARARGPAARTPSGPALETGRSRCGLSKGRVPPEWIDYNGHMTESRYLQVFGETTDALLARIGVDAAYVAAGHSYYTVETHIMHLGEAKLGDAFHATTQILATDEKRIRLFHRIACRRRQGARDRRADAAARRHESGPRLPSTGAGAREARAAGRRARHTGMAAKCRPRRRRQSGVGLLSAQGIGPRLAGTDAF